MHGKKHTLTQNMAKANAMSVISKTLTGAMIIMIVGVCAYLCLIILMAFI